MDGGRLSDAHVREVIEAATGIDSDFYKAEVLSRVARRYRLEGATRQAMIDVIDTIESSFYRGEVSQLVLRR